MKWTYRLSAPRLDLAGLKKSLDKHMRGVIAQAVMEWLEAVLIEIPVWSGASKATFLKLSEAIGYSLPVSPADGRIDRTGMGIASSTGELETDIDEGIFAFKYGTSLPWLIWNEYHNANIDPDPTLFYRVIKEGPYNFQIKGLQAFLRFADTVALPPVAPFIKPVRVK